MHVGHRRQSENCEPSKGTGVQNRRAVFLIAPDKSVEVDPAGIADRVGLREPADVGGVGAGLVMMEAELVQQMQ